MVTPTHNAFAALDGDASADTSQEGRESDGFQVVTRRRRPGPKGPTNEPLSDGSHLPSGGPPVQSTESLTALLQEARVADHPTPAGAGPGGKSGGGSAAAEPAVGGGAAGAPAGGEDGEQAKGAKLQGALVWIDLEMTGLDPQSHRILEIACIITDGRLNSVIEGPDVVIHETEEVLAAMNDWCKVQHAASGLVERVRESTTTLEEAEAKVLAFVEEHTEAGNALLAGNSIYVDLRFLQVYMPALARRFPHVLVDVSTVRALSQRWYPKDAHRAPRKTETHRALSDIRESIEQLRFLRGAVFKKSKHWSER